jgi:diguanylate cyclase (GGDEF)-like protein
MNRHAGLTLDCSDVTIYNVRMRAKIRSLHLVDGRILLRSVSLAEKKYSIGRSQTNDIVLDGKSVSRNHARITCTLAHCVIEDVGSANGTRVNGKTVKATVLQHGDEIAIGECTVVYDDGEGIQGITDQTQVETPGTETKSLAAHAQALAQKIQSREVAREFSDLNKKMTRSREKYKRLAHEDRLTGLDNRALFDRTIREWFDQARLGKKPLSLIFIDIDHFKKVNDTYGHAQGDEALKAVAQLIRTALRKEDMVARYGGEEFVALCFGMSSDNAWAAAESLRNLVERATPGILRFPITVSAGIATFPEHCQKGEDLLRFADQALYHAKSSGRNRVVKYHG